MVESHFPNEQVVVAMDHDVRVDLQEDNIELDCSLTCVSMSEGPRVRKRWKRLSKRNLSGNMPSVGDDRKRKFDDQGKL